MHSRRKSGKFKGCCMMCAMNDGAIRGLGTARKLRFSELRRIGKKRRLAREIDHRSV